MKKIKFLLFLFPFFLTGCITTTTYLKPRVDQEISGNKGYIVGEIPEVKSERKFDKRRIVEVEIEVPPFKELFRGKSK